MKKFTALLLALALALSLFGCSSGSTASSPSASAAAAPAKVTGQKWIDSDIQGNVTADSTADPTDDFALSVNKEWALSATVPAGETEASSFSEATANVKKQITGLLAAGGDKSSEGQLVTQLYNDTVDMDARNAAGVAPAKQYVDAILNIKDTDGLSQYLSSPTEQFGGYNNGLVMWLVDSDMQDSTQYAVYISPSSLSLSDAAEYASLTSLGKTRKAAGEQFFVKMLGKFGVNESEAKKRYADMLAFETELASAEMTTAQTHTADYYASIYNPMSLADIQKEGGDFPIAGVLKPFTDTGRDTFVLMQPEWLKKLASLYTNDHVEAMKDMILFRLFNSCAANLDQDCLDLLDEYNSSVSGTKISSDPADTAYNTCNDHLGWAVGKMYADHFCDEATKQEVTNLVKEVIAVYRTRLENCDWLTAATKQKAVEKLDAIRIRIAYPDDWSKYTYTGLTLKTKAEGGSLFADLVSLNRCEAEQSIAKSAGPVDKDKWGNDQKPQNINGAYFPPTNSICICAAILQKPFYDKEGGEAAVMGGVGSTIAHELTHAFDSAGSQYDKSGNMVNWWTQEDAAAFKQRTDKVSAYFSTFEPIAGVKVNGDATIGETVADLGSMSCMLEIAKTKTNFDYKTFFAAWAKDWKLQKSASAEEDTIRADNHPPQYLRINAIVQQFPEFYEAYGVKEGDNMYLAPADRLSVW